MEYRQNIFRMSDRGKYIYVSKLKGNRYQFVFKSESGQYYYIETDREYDIDNEAMLHELEGLGDEIFLIRSIVYDEIKQKFQISGIYKEGEKHYKFNMHNGDVVKEEEVTITTLEPVVDNFVFKKFSHPLGDVNGNIVLAICEDEDGYDSLALFDLKEQELLVEYPFNSDRYVYKFNDFCVNSDMKVVAVGSRIDKKGDEYCFITEVDPLIKQLF